MSFEKQRRRKTNTKSKYSSTAVCFFKVAVCIHPIHLNVFVPTKAGCTQSTHSERWRPAISIVNRSGLARALCRPCFNNYLYSRWLSPLPNAFTRHGIPFAQTPDYIHRHKDACQRGAALPESKEKPPPSKFGCFYSSFAQ